MGPNFDFNTDLVLALVASTLLDSGLALLLCCRLAARRSARRLDFPRTLLVWACVLAIWVPKLLLLSELGLYRFGRLHLVYLDLFVVLPVLGGLLLLAELAHRRPSATVPRLLSRLPRELTRSVRAACWAALGLGALGFYATWIEPRWTVLERTEIRLSPGRAGRSPLRIGVIADVQTPRVGDHEREAFASLLAQEPDLILLPGDFYSGPDEGLPPVLADFRELLGGLHAPGGVFAVLGNADPEYRTAHELLAGTGVRLLLDEIVEVVVRDRRITLAGNRLLWNGEAARELAAALESRAGAEDVRILLSHYPDALYNLSPDSRVDLLVAGHTHGGQVRIPFYGPLITLSRVPRRIAAGGLHEREGRRLYVSRGLGLERGQAPRLRFNCRPEISLLTLE